MSCFCYFIRFIIICPLCYVLFMISSPCPPLAPAFLVRPSASVSLLSFFCAFLFLFAPCGLLCRLFLPSVLSGALLLCPLGPSVDDFFLRPRSDGRTLSVAGRGGSGQPPLPSSHRCPSPCGGAGPCSPRVGRQGQPPFSQGGCKGPAVGAYRPPRGLLAGA